MLAHHFSQLIADHHSSKDPVFRDIVRRLCELTESGSSCINLHLKNERSIKQWKSLLSRDQAGSAVVSPGGSAPLILTDDGFLYLQRYYLHEHSVFQKIDTAARTEANTVEEKTLSQLNEILGSPDENDQAKAALCALRNRLTIISGGPGTGKTTTVVSILELLRTSGHLTSAEDCLLLAPTGKAADRLKQSILSGIKFKNYDAKNFPTETSTIHRALGYRHGCIEFKHHGQNPLQAKVVVVDETSMVDLPLMARLLDAIADDARIILLGDQNQLASVQVGSVLSDLMQAARHDAPLCENPELPLFDAPPHPISNCTVTLTTSHRTKGPVNTVCDAIRDGNADAAWHEITSSPEDVTGAIIQTPPAANLRSALNGFVAQHWLPVLRDDDLSISEKIKGIDQFRILCPTHKGLYGVESINQTIDQILSAHGIPKRDTWYPGRSVIIQQNDYGAGIFNGDIGLTWPHEDDSKSSETKPEIAPSSLSVHFQTGDKIKSIAPSLLPSCQTAWALTIHRTQGSEYDHILIIVPPSEDSKILTRELLYTGLSRAKKSATLWCTEESLRSTIGQTVQRASGLAEMFAQNTQA